MDDAEPKLSDYYSMQVATEVRRGWVKNPGRVKMEQFRLKPDVKVTKYRSAEEEAAIAKAVWKARVGL